MSALVLRLTLCAAALPLVSGAPLRADAQASPAPAAASPQPAETAPPIPAPQPAADDPKVHKIAVQQFLAWQTASVDRDMYSDTVNAQLTDDLLDRATKTLANLGALQSAAFLGISKANVGNLYVYKMTCANGTVNMDFSLDRAGKIALIFFV